MMKEYNLIVAAMDEEMEALLNLLNHPSKITIKNEELYAVKNERGHYEIDTARIKFPYLKGMLEEREKIEENIKKCQSLIAK